MLGPEGLTRQSSTFTRREVIQQLAEVHPEGAPAGHLERLADDFLARTCVALTRAGDDTDRGHREALYTTPDMLRAEVRLIDAATGRDPHGPVVADTRTVDAVISHRPTLGADQEAAVRHLCSGEARVRVMEARAGTGKTFTLAAVREAYERSGVPVIGVAWQGQAADVLQREAGIPSQTAALLLRRIERGEDDAIPARSVIVVDEASVMPTRALERLAHAAAWRSARLVPGRRPRPASRDRRRRRLRRARRSPRRGRAHREPPPGRPSCSAGSPRIWPRGAPPTRWRCCPRAGASSPSTTRATRAWRWWPRGPRRSSTRPGAT